MKVHSKPVAAAFAVLLLMSACSGGSSAGDETPPAAEDGIDESAPEVEPSESAPPTEDEFIAAADSVCTESARLLVENDNRFADPKIKTKKQIAELDDELLRLVAERVENLETLTAPAELSGDFDEYLQTRREAHETLEQRVSAAEAKDNKTVRKLDKRLEALVEDYTEIGTEIGFFACAERLDSAAKKEATATITEYFTKVDPATAKKTVTKLLLKVSGGPEKIIEGLLPSKKVTIRELRGVIGVRADAEVILDAYDDLTLTVTLYFEDGSYKINGYE